jgi:ATP-dependent Clp protease ATP-binding subunit ClpC
MNGYNFTERVRKVLAIARGEAARLQHEYVGPEHILLGIVGEGDGVAMAVLQSLQIDPDEVRHSLDWHVKRGSHTPSSPDLAYTSRAKKVLELAMSEARELNHAYVGTEHLLMGLLREEKSVAAQVLTELGLSVDTARAELLRLLGSTVKPSPLAAHGAPPAPAESGRQDADPLDRRRAMLEASWVQLRGLLDLAERTGTPVRLDRVADGVVDLVLGDDLLRAPVPRWPVE